MQDGVKTVRKYMIISFVNLCKKAFRQVYMPVRKLFIYSLSAASSCGSTYESISCHNSLSPCLVCDEKGIRISSCLNPSPVLTAFTCLLIWLLLILSSFVATITVTVIYNPVIHHSVIIRWVMTDIYQQEHLL